jgi:thioredoxin 1
MNTLSKSAALDDVRAFVSSSPVPVLIDCFTPACAPCAALAPILDELSEQRQGRLAIEKIDVSANPGVARGLGVRGVPTLLLYRDGELKATRSGAITQTQLMEWLSANDVH